VKYIIKSFVIDGPLPFGTFRTLAEITIDEEFAAPVMEAVMRSFADLFNAELRETPNRMSTARNHPIFKWMLDYADLESVADQVVYWRATIWEIKDWKIKDSVI